MKFPLKHFALALLLANTIATTLWAPGAHAISLYDRKATINDTTHFDITPITGLVDLATCAGDIQLSGENVRDTYIFLRSKGLTPAQVSGVIGNLMQESGASLDPTIQQDGSNDPFPKNGVGFGIAQWTYSDRQKPLIALAEKLGLPPGNLKVQLNYLWQELNTTHKRALTDLKQQTTVSSATTSFERLFEGCGDCVESKRIANAQAVFDRALKEQWVAADGTSANDRNSANAATPSGCFAGGTAAAAKIVKIASAEVGNNEGGTINRGGSCKYQLNTPSSSCPGEAWCADFVSWVYKQAGVPFDGGQGPGGWRIARAIDVAGWFKQHGTWIPNPGSPVPVNDPRAPKPGDVMLYPKSDVNAGGSGHVNIVVSYDGKVVKTIGGNQSDAVRYGVYERNTFDVTQVVGWGRLK